MRIGSPRLGKFLQVGARAALHLRRTGNTAEWKTIACRSGLLQGGCREGAIGKYCRVCRQGGCGLRGVSVRIGPATLLFSSISERARMAEEWEFMKGRLSKSSK